MQSDPVKALLEERTVVSELYPNLITVLLQDPFAAEKNIIEDGIMEAILEYGEVPGNKPLFLDKFGKNVYVELYKKVNQHNLGYSQHKPIK